MNPHDERPDTDLEAPRGCVVAANVAAAVLITVLILAIAYAAAR